MSDRSLSKTIAAGKNILSRKAVKLYPLVVALSFGLSACSGEQKNVGVVIGLIALIGLLGTLKLPDLSDFISKRNNRRDGDT